MITEYKIAIFILPSLTYTHNNIVTYGHTESNRSNKLIFEKVVLFIFRHYNDSIRLAELNSNEVSLSLGKFL